MPKGIMVVFYDDLDWRADAPETMLTRALNVP